MRKAGNTARDAVDLCCHDALGFLAPPLCVRVRRGVESGARSFKVVLLDSDWMSILCASSLTVSVGHTITRWYALR